MDDLSRLLAERACERLVVRYAELIDFDKAEQVADLFVPDGVWESDRSRKVGEAGSDGILGSANEGVLAFPDTFAQTSLLQLLVMKKPWA